jgi:hypothetical protein
VTGILLGVLAMAVTVFVETLGALRPLEFMPFASTKTESNQDSE